MGSWRDVGVMNYPEIMRVEYQNAVVESFAGKYCTTIDYQRWPVPEYSREHVTKAKVGVGRWPLAVGNVLLTLVALDEDRVLTSQRDGFPQKSNLLTFRGKSPSIEEPNPYTLGFHKAATAGAYSKYPHRQSPRLLLLTVVCNEKHNSKA